MAGIIHYLAPVDNASGKIFGKKQKWVAVRRKIGKRQRGCSVTGERVAPVTTGEINQRQKFSAVSKATLARLKNAEFVAADMAAFAAQTKYSTLRGYVFSQEWEAYGE